MLDSLIDPLYQDPKLLALDRLYRELALGGMIQLRMARANAFRSLEGEEAYHRHVGLQAVRTLKKLPRIPKKEKPCPFLTHKRAALQGGPRKTI